MVLDDVEKVLSRDNFAISRFKGQTFIYIHEKIYSQIGEDRLKRITYRARWKGSYPFEFHAPGEQYPFAMIVAPSVFKWGELPIFPDEADSLVVKIMNALRNLP